MLVEDDTSLRRVLGRALRGAGFEVFEAATGWEALDLLESQPPEAVVLDLGLPNASTPAVLDYLRQPGREGDRGPIWVIISALEPEDASRQYGPLGGHFLPKPFNPRGLIRMLESLLSAKGQH